MQPLRLQKEFDLLYEKEFLLPGDKQQDIQINKHEHEIWAKVFWRRRFRHAKREDPELQFVFQQNPSTLLEIGAGYGRVLRKLVERNGGNKKMRSIQGIDICEHFAPYFHLYKTEYPSLRNVEMIYDNFLESQKLKENSCDIILLPMNTIPSFSIDLLKTLFITVGRYLTKDGMFLFSNYKIPDKERVSALINRRQGHSGELLLELGSGFIAAEYYDLPARKTEYGAYNVTYARYNTFSRDNTLQKKELFRSQTEFILHQHLQKIIETCGLSIEIFDDTSHSFTYGLTKQ
ncbi:hypothetical protein CEE45_15885 [Candidatus Heimdallarchaeota archaeon B3_Heim]|nr:MAG: hypothetical protein CEE45_15885 [Candidatus Heimdallarchaeota archaeon B3_Heim]